MPHYLPVEEIEEDLQSAVEEFEAGSKELQKEEEQLEMDMIQALEKQKMDEVRKKLNTV